MCDSFDDCCCPNEDKAIFFGVWTLVHGIVFLFGHYAIYVFEKKCFQCTGIPIIILACVIHINAGINVLLGILMNQKKLILVGITLSWILPVINFYFIYLLVVQIIFTIILYRFYFLELE